MLKMAYEKRELIWDASNINIYEVLVGDDDDDDDVNEVLFCSWDIIIAFDGCECLLALHWLLSLVFRENGQPLGSSIYSFSVRWVP